MDAVALGVRLRQRAIAAAEAGEASSSVAELSPVARLVAGDERTPALRARAEAWLVGDASYHELVRLGADYVEALDEREPPAESVYVPKVAGELEDLLALWPWVLALPTVEALTARDVIRLRAHPVHVLGIVARTTWADGRPCSPAEYFFHDLDHARYKVREDLAARGIAIPDAYVDGGTLDPTTGRHRRILPAARELAGPEPWRGSGERVALVERLLAAVDAQEDGALAAAAELLLFEVVHEKSFPLDAAVLARELAIDAHLDKLRRKLASGFFGPHAPDGETIGALARARRILEEAL